MTNTAMSGRGKDMDLQKQIAVLMVSCQGLMQREKVDIDNEESAQISIVAKKTLAQRLWSPNKLFMTISLFFLLLRLCYVTDMIKILELGLLVITILFKTEFGHLLFVKSCIIALFLVLNRYYDNSSISLLMVENIAVNENLWGSTLQKQKLKKMNGIATVRIQYFYFFTCSYSGT